MLYGVGMTNATTTLRPILPIVGDAVELFGLIFVVDAVEPHSDWVWAVELIAPNGDRTSILLPTDSPTF